MLDPTMIELSRWQFAITALYHFLFVPLTLGLTWILVIMELVYVMTSKEIYRDMTKFYRPVVEHPTQASKQGRPHVHF